MIISVPCKLRSGKQSYLVLLLLFVAVAVAFSSNNADAVDDLGSASTGELNLYLTLAKACELSYDDEQAGLIITPSGCVALTQLDSYGNLIIAFRGSMLADRNPKHPFSSFGCANIRRGYRDWVATNLKQTAGFLPRQYVEAATVVEELLIKHPVDKYVFVTGHSKGGGGATYASIVSHFSSQVSPEQLQRMRTVTFNASVVREQNWRRFFRRLDPDIEATPVAALTGSIRALVMEDDPVSKIAIGEERDYVRRITIVPSTSLTPTEQHAIRSVINELGTRLGLPVTP